MNKFVKGELVKLTYKHPIYRNYGIAEHYFGREFSIIDCNDPNDYYLINGHGQLFSVFNCMLEPMGGPW